MMPKINVYLPDDLAAAVRDAGIPVSAVCQRALADAVAAADGHPGKGFVAGTSQDHAPPSLTRLTNRARAVIDFAHNAADHDKHRPDSIDVVAGLVDEGHNLAVAVLGALGIDAADVLAESRALALTRHRAAHNQAGETVTGEPRTQAAHPTSGPSPVAEVLERAALEAMNLNHNYIGCEHLLLGIMAGPPDEPVTSTLSTMGVDYASARGAVQATLVGYSYAQANLSFSGLSAPIRSVLDEIRQRLSRLEQTKRN